MNSAAPHPAPQANQGTPVAWHTVFHNPDDIDGGWAADWPLFLDLLSNRTYTWGRDAGGGHGLVKGPTESIQRFVPDSFLAANGWMGVVGATTVLARGFVEGWNGILHGHVDPAEHPKREHALPNHWSDFQRRFGLAIGPRCVVLTQARDALFQPHLPFTGVPGSLAHTALGCIFQALDASAHDVLAQRRAVDTWAKGLVTVWNAMAIDQVCRTPLDQSR
jgi:hypothetical protein